jgi:hypothetical protein
MIAPGDERSRAAPPPELPRVVRGGAQPGRPVAQNERTTSVRQGGGKEEGERATLGEPEDRGLPRPGGIHDCTDIRHLGLDVGETIERHWIQARSPPVEDNQAPDGSQPPPLARQLLGVAIDLQPGYLIAPSARPGTASHAGVLPYSEWGTRLAGEGTASQRVTALLGHGESAGRLLFRTSLNPSVAGSNPAPATNEDAG